MILLKWILNKQGGRVLTEFIWLMVEMRGGFFGSFKAGNEL
jgi:hypothetical protein